MNQRAYRHTIPLYVTEAMLLVTNIIAWSLGAHEDGPVGVLTQDGLLLTIIVTLAMAAFPVALANLSYRIGGTDRAVAVMCWLFTGIVGFILAHDLLVVGGYLR